MKILILVSLTLVAACVPSLEKTKLDFVESNITDGPLSPAGEVVTFKLLKEKLLTPHCIGCHDNLSDEKDVLDLISIENPEDSLIYQVIKDGSMPSGGTPLDSRYLELVLDYVKSARPSDKKIAIEDAPKFQEINEKILIPHCIACHRGMISENAIQKFITPGNPEASKIYQLIESGKMPKKGPKLSIDQINLMANYIRSMAN